MKLNCIITDDEPIAREIMESFVQKVPGLSLVAKCANVPETIQALRDNHVDLLFLDIQMPEVSGLEFIRSQEKCPMVIFTTAHPAFAVDAFELDAVDYLLKPVSDERFRKAFEKALIRIRFGMIEKTPDKFTTETKDGNSFFVKSNADMIRLNFEEILYIEGLENYVRFVCQERSVIVLRTMKSLLEILPPGLFLRIHRSYIVNVKKIDSFCGNYFSVNGHELRVGKSYKKMIRGMKAGSGSVG
jgi:DNA-binding LytR/AlgR family response regulator